MWYLSEIKTKPVYEAKKIVEWLEKGQSGPVTLHLRYTEKCNLNCMMCELGKKTQGNDKGLETNKILDIIDQASELGVNFLLVTGGEPFTRKEALFRTLERATMHDMKTILVTNGTLLNKKNVKRLAETKIQELQISLDGPDAKTHDFIRSTKHAFKKVINTLAYLRDFNKETGVIKPKVNLVTVLTNRNYDKIEELLYLINEMGIEKFTLQPLQRRTEDCGNLKPDEKQKTEFEKKLDHLISVAEKEGIENNLSFFKEDGIIENSFVLGKELDQETCELYDRVSRHCYSPWLNMSIRTDGSVEPCFHRDFKEENIYQKDLEKIWHGKLFQKIRTEIEKGDFSTECEDCCGRLVLDNKNLLKEVRKLSSKKEI